MKMPKINIPKIKLPKVKMPKFLIPIFGEPVGDEVYESFTEDKHRDSKYKLPSELNQMWTAFMVQMKLFMKSYLPIVMLLLVAAIPLIVYSGVLDGLIINTIRSEIGDTGETHMAISLGLLSVMTILISCMVCGTMLASEFRFRTAFLNFSIPQSRTTLYFGKFLAGFVLVAATVLLAFFVSIVMANLAGYGSVSTAAAGQALLLALAGSFAFCCIAYGMSAFMSHGSTMLPFVLIFIIMSAFGLVTLDAAGIGHLAGYIPSLSGDLALACLGSDQTLSVALLLNMETDMSASVPLAALVSIITGAAVLTAGLFRTLRREI